MSYMLELNQTFRIVLEKNRGAPKESQPYFEFYYLSSFEWQKIADVASEINSSSSKRQVFDRAFDILQIGLAGWGNLINPKTNEQIPYDPEKLKHLVTTLEANELLAKFRNQGFEGSVQRN